MKIGTIMAIKKAWDALMVELKFLMKPIEWIFNQFTQHQQRPSHERTYGGHQKEPK